MKKSLILILTICLIFTNTLFTNTVSANSVSTYTVSTNAEFQSNNLALQTMQLSFFSDIFKGFSLFKPKHEEIFADISGYIQDSSHTDQEKCRKIVDYLISSEKRWDRHNTEHKGELDNPAYKEFYEKWIPIGEYLTSMGGEAFAEDCKAHWHSLETYKEYYSEYYRESNDSKYYYNNLIDYMYENDTKNDAKMDQPVSILNLFYIAYAENIKEQEMGYLQYRIKDLGGKKPRDYEDHCLSIYEDHLVAKEMKAKSPFYEDDSEYQKLYKAYNKEYKRIVKGYEKKHGEGSAFSYYEDYLEHLQRDNQWLEEYENKKSTQSRQSNGSVHKNERDDESFDKEGFYEDHKDIYHDYDDAADDFDDEGEYDDDY